MTAPNPNTLLQAALARLGARLGSGLVDAAANLALLAQDAPEKLRQEAELFWQEVQQEAERLERNQDQPGTADQPFSAAAERPMEPGMEGVSSAELQDQIDGLRARVAGLARRLDQRP